MHAFAVTVPTSKTFHKAMSIIGDLVEEYREDDLQIAARDLSPEVLQKLAALGAKVDDCGEA